MAHIGKKLGLGPGGRLSPLLGQEQIIFHFLPLREVDGHAGKAHISALFIFEHIENIEGREQAAIFSLYQKLAFQMAEAHDLLDHLLYMLAHIFRHYGLGNALAQYLLCPPLVQDL